VYSVDSEFQEAIRCYNLLRDTLSDKITIIFVGNRIDQTERIVSFEMARKFAIENEASFVEISAATYQNVELLSNIIHSISFNLPFEPIPQDVRMPTKSARAN
jgi:50S ribosomal subunit-associated GTPase HflX